MGSSLRASSSGIPAVAHTAKVAQGSSNAASIHIRRAEVAFNIAATDGPKIDAVARQAIRAGDRRMQLRRREKDDSADFRQQPKLRFVGIERKSGWLDARIFLDELSHVLALNIAHVVIKSLGIVLNCIGKIPRIKRHAIVCVQRIDRKPPVDLSHWSAVPGVAMPRERVSNSFRKMTGSDKQSASWGHRRGNRRGRLPVPREFSQPIVSIRGDA